MISISGGDAARFVDLLLSLPSPEKYSEGIMR